MRSGKVLGLVGVANSLALLAAVYVAAQTPAVWTVESVGTFSGGDRRLVLRAPKGTPGPTKGQQVTVTVYTPPPPPPPPCTFTVAPTSTSVGQDGGAVTATVTASAASCSSTAASAAAWLTVSPDALTGSGPVTITAAPNPDTAARQGVVTIAGVAVTVEQAAKVQPPVLIWGIVDASTLGTCTERIHDTFTVDGGDGWRYRTWHPQTVTVDGTTCTFGHEHGDDPARMTNAEIAAQPVRFGYIGRRMDHEEAHEGFKVFIALPGDVNDEGRMNRVFSRSVFHMGTGGPKRFATQHHSADIRLIHPEFGLKAFTQLMHDTGGVATVCDPRVTAPTKDVVQLASPCKLNSFYEIWSTQASVRFQGREVYRAFATPAVFDPITVFNPADPAAVVYAWDRRVDAILNFPGNDRSYFRGCDRESYAQPGYWYNAGGRTTYTTDAMGAELPASDPRALVQTISASNAVGPTAAPATNDGLAAFKRRVNYCGVRSALGLKN